MKSHASAIDMLKRQHQRAESRGVAVTACSQTDTSVRDIEMLESFRQKYLETLAKMKADMMKEFDAQTCRVTERVSRQINEDRQTMREKVSVILMPKVSELLREFRVSETMIRVKMDELQGDLAQITASLVTTAKRESNSTTATASATASATATATATAAARQNKINESVQLSKEGIAKRSVSTLMSSVASKTAVSGNPTALTAAASVSDLSHSPLYSKSTSSIQNGSEFRATGQTPSKTPTIGEHKVNDSSHRQSFAATLTSGYKYTPLRQSWNNLSQMNVLSPTSSYSPSVNNAGNSSHLDNARKKLNEENGSGGVGVSPSLLNNIKRITTSRPNMTSSGSSLANNIEQMSK